MVESGERERVQAPKCLPASQILEGYLTMKGYRRSYHIPVLYSLVKSLSIMPDIL